MIVLWHIPVIALAWVVAAVNVAVAKSLYPGIDWIDNVAIGVCAFVALCGVLVGVSLL